MLAQPAATGSG